MHLNSKPVLRVHSHFQFYNPIYPAFLLPFFPKDSNCNENDHSTYYMHTSFAHFFLVWKETERWRIFKQSSAIIYTHLDKTKRNVMDGRASSLQSLYTKSLISLL